MSYDYDGMEVELDDGTFTIFIGSVEYTYEIEEHGDLLIGGIENGVDVEYIGKEYDMGEASVEDMDEYYNKELNYNEEEDDRYNEGYDYR